MEQFVKQDAFEADAFSRLRTVIVSVLHSFVGFSLFPDPILL